MTRRLSRLALVVLAPFVAPSCLVTAKQDFPAPPQTPPFLSASAATPSLQHLRVLASGTEAVDFSTIVRSEDDGVNLEARLIVDDIFADKPLLLHSAIVAASTFGDTGRQISLRFDPAVPPETRGSVTPGCHRFTLLVSHAFVKLSNQPQSDGDQDFLVWWVVQGNPKDTAFAEKVVAAGCGP